MKIRILGSALVVGLISVVNFSSLGTAKALAQQGTYRSLQSYNFPTFYIRHRNLLGEISTISSSLDKQDATFKIVTGLADSNCISFQSQNNPGAYLRHQEFRIKLATVENSQLFKADATFCQRSGLADSTLASFESYNFPGHYLRHSSSNLYIQKDEGELFRKDATFRMVNPMGLNPVTFPITGDKENGVANGRMRTSFTLNADGSLTAVTNTRTGIKLAGFTGAASVILVDENRQLIWASGVHSYGVDGCFIGRCNRNDNWSENVPPEIMSRVRGYAILQQHNPKWRVFDRGAQFLRWLNSDEGKATVSTIATIIAML
ncbi:MAG: AbfB domain-containing protein [Microcoleus anatoxicus]|uniref:AbfB domain-containing protein n=1 Tax=Microcoleus anatoxicus TaxID=2705319 RepID=UPI0036715AA0